MTLERGAEHNSLGIQINAPTLSSLFRHVFPLFSSFTTRFTHASSADEFHYGACLSWECIRAHVAAFMHVHVIILGRFPDAYTVHSCTVYDSLSLQQRPKVADRARSREEYLEKRWRVEEKSMLKRGARCVYRVYSDWTADLIVEIEIYFKCRSVGSL